MSQTTQPSYLAPKQYKTQRPAGLQIDSQTLSRLKDQALAKARKLQEKVRGFMISVQFQILGSNERADCFRVLGRRALP